MASRSGLAAPNNSMRAREIRFSRAEWFVVRADEKLTAFVELESAICVSGDAYS
jgi:hypothetical protein